MGEYDIVYAMIDHVGAMALGSMLSLKRLRARWYDGLNRNSDIP